MLREEELTELGSRLSLLCESLLGICPGVFQTLLRPGFVPRFRLPRFRLRLVVLLFPVFQAPVSGEMVGSEGKFL